MTTDIENQELLQVTSTSDLSESTDFSWTVMEDLLRKDDKEVFSKLLVKHNFYSVWRPHDSYEYGRKTALHKAAELGSIGCMELLLKSLPDHNLVDSPDAEGCTPIFAALKSCNLDSLEILLRYNANINCRNDQGHSILHKMAYGIKEIKDESNLKTMFKCCDLILENSNIDLEAHNNSGYTPLVTAAKLVPLDQGTRRSCGMVSFCRKLVSCGASLESTDGMGLSAREILENSNALVEALMGERKQPPERNFYSTFIDSIILEVSSLELKNRLMGQPQEEYHRIAKGYIGSKSLLFYFVERNDPLVVQTLLQAGADPTEQELKAESSLERCLYNGNIDILNLILEKIKRTDKVEIVKNMSFNLMQKIFQNPNNCNDKHLKCLERLLEENMLDLNQRTSGKVSETILHVAAAANNQEALRILLEHGAYIGSERQLVDENMGNILPVLQPKVLSTAMDNCIKPKNEESEIENLQDPDYALTLNYAFLLPPSNEIKNENESLMSLSSSKVHRKVMTHPLIQSFLYAKWRKILPYFMINFILYALFVVFLTAFMYKLKDLRIAENNWLNDTENTTLYERYLAEKGYTDPLKGILLALTIYMIIREGFQMFFANRMYYKNFENYLEWFLIIVVIIVCSITLSVESSRHLAAWSMIIAWYEFVLLLGKAPQLSIYVVMLSYVSRNFLKLIFLYGALILAFSLSFNILFQPQGDDSDFTNFWSTLPKAIVMATGEFEYSDLSSDFSKKALFATSAILIFLFFLFLIFLVLMNVMNGIAVADTRTVVDDTILYSLRSRLELIYLIEELLLKIPFLRRFLPKIQMISGDKKHNLIAWINLPNQSERIQYGQDHEEKCKMDAATADLLRSHRLDQIEKKQEASRLNPIVECLQILQEMRGLEAQHDSATVSPSSSRGNLS